MEACKSMFDYIANGHSAGPLNNVEQIIEYNIFMYVLIYLVLIIIFCKVFIVIHYAHEKFTRKNTVYIIKIQFIYRNMNKIEISLYITTIFVSAYIYFIISLTTDYESIYNFILENKINIDFITHTIIFIPYFEIYSSHIQSMYIHYSTTVIGSYRGIVLLGPIQ